MTISRRLSLPLCAAILSFSSHALGQAAPDLGNAPYEWKNAFPIWGKEVAKKGIELPLPWGAGINYSYVDQPIEITSIDIAVNDSDYVDISELIEFEEIRSRVHVLNARLDLWLFPFLNVYGLGLYAPETNTDVTIGAPFSLETGATQSGVGGGFGMTAAFGLGGFFGIVDMNWTWNKMENLNEPVSTFIVTPRFGKNFGKVGPVRLIG